MPNRAALSAQETCASVPSGRPCSAVQCRPEQATDNHHFFVPANKVPLHDQPGEVAPALLKCAPGLLPLARRKPLRYPTRHLTESSARADAMSEVTRILSAIDHGEPHAA